MHSWLHGPPGCGKTSVARYVLEALQEQVTVPWTYVNCWTTPTLHSIADSISKDLRILSAQVQSTSFKLEKLEQYIGNRVPCGALDGTPLRVHATYNMPTGCCLDGSGPAHRSDRARAATLQSIQRLPNAGREAA